MKRLFIIALGLALSAPKVEASEATFKDKAKIFFLKRAREAALVTMFGGHAVVLLPLSTKYKDRITDLQFVSSFFVGSLIGMLVAVIASDKLKGLDIKFPNEKIFTTEQRKYSANSNCE